MKYLLILSLLLSGLFGFGQKPANNPIDMELSLLVNRKMQYEKWLDMAQRSRSTLYTTKKDSVYQLYMGMIKTVKSCPKVYLTHINKAIKAGKVEYDGPERIEYNYFNPGPLPFDSDLYFLSRLEAYKVIKRSLFEKNESQLPERTELYIKKGGKGRGFPIPILPPRDKKDTIWGGDQEIH
ncbi:hypothetical protein [Pedobacter chitinilyticus]|uniref:GLPGLI family protein n=1 Tax=Pedobacter chitinilyticus TaxID=2233776 RepID=A0A3S4RPP3_9SPHI|nr:hypothetical protein [Pedobacter chitinilyticus]RWU06299.1 hypothetical protein DPV69_13485 [Pedobacter chitinilyticus]